MAMTADSRRAFLRGVFGAAAGGAATAALSGCQFAVGGPSDGASYQTGVIAPNEVVPLRPGVRYYGEMPTALPFVRTLRSVGTPSWDYGTTKAG
jgi:hypothetical protein